MPKRAGLIVAFASLVAASTAGTPAGAAPRPASASFTTLHSFTGGADGANPVSGLIAVDGTLYGTTVHGGPTTQGVAYAIGTHGHERVLHAFGSATDGWQPYAGLLLAGGTLYGATEAGGTTAGPCRFGGCGTVFSLTTAGSETVVHRFHGNGDSNSPLGTPIALNGSLYGTTEGRAAVYGTVYRIDASGAEHIVHHFQNGTDGAYPAASLIALNGALYGTTVAGGSSSHGGSVYRLTPAGDERIVHAFTANSDGRYPYAPVYAYAGVLYGTTAGGGAGSGLNGTVFAIDTAGNERVLHTFGANSADGVNPFGGLVALNGALYGTTTYGGAHNDGTVYEITPSGAETVVHTFSGVDGSYPMDALIAVNGTLYGTTQNGGAAGLGTVFALTP
jgi:uncharacterized repeat protein (TIGR03803 family)